MADHSTGSLTHRRGFLARLAAAGVAVATGGALPRTLAAADSSDDLPAPSDRWIEAMRGKHRQIFDSPQPSGGLPLIHVRNYLNAYRDAYGAKPGEVKAAVSLYLMTVPLAFNDAMWEKYKFGEATKVVDTSTKQPATHNVFVKAPDGSQTLLVDGPVPVPSDASITALQARGTTFLLCNNAFNFWIGQLAAGTKGDPTAIRAELSANALPGIEVVPAMVVAFNLAQEHGISYMYLA
jgi:hypothetical protein